MPVKKRKAKKKVGRPRKVVRGKGVVSDNYKKVKKAARKVAPYALGLGSALAGGYLLYNAPSAFENYANSRRQNWYGNQTGIKYKYIK